MIVPKNHVSNIAALNEADASLFAEAISKITKAYDTLFNTSFPYSSGIHQAPTNGNDNTHWHWHMSLYPLCYEVQPLKNLWLVMKCLDHHSVILQLNMLQKN